MSNPEKNGTSACQQTSDVEVSLALTTFLGAQNDAGLDYENILLEFKARFSKPN